MLPATVFLLFFAFSPATSCCVRSANPHCPGSRPILAATPDRPLGGEVGGGAQLLAIVPLMMCIGFIRVALAPSFIILAALMIVRRIGNMPSPVPVGSSSSRRSTPRVNTKPKASSIPSFSAQAMPLAAGSKVHSSVGPRRPALRLSLQGAHCSGGCLGWRLGKQSDESNAKSSDLAVDNPTQGFPVERAGILYAPLQRRRVSYRHLLETHILRRQPSRVVMYYKRKKSSTATTTVCRQ